MPVATTAVTRTFRGNSGGDEHFIIVQAPGHLDLDAQIDHLQRQYDEALAENGLAPDTAVFRRIYLSDAPNQAVRVRQSRLFDDPDAGETAVAIVQQPPLPDAKVALLAYHIADSLPMRKHRLADNHVLVEKRGTRHLWSTRLCSAAANAPVPTAQQTRDVFPT